ncbi:MAG TPA: GTPase Era [Candidatus Kapabacteria bacterium]|nr:GTPase Era [Candidatus Kapabacteria bacterium]
MTTTDQNESSSTPGFRTGYVTIIGEPNVGKSTLLNSMLGAKLSIVTNKPQTTRKNVLGILTSDTAQIIFRDTPGVITPRYLLQEKMLGYVATAVADADVLLLMLDASDPDLERLASTPLGDVRELNKPVILFLNKIDKLLDRKEVLPVMEKFNAAGIFREVIPGSGLHAQNTDHLASVIAGYLPEGPPLYDPELLSEQPQRFFVAELIREQILKQYKQEIPYSVEVVIVQYKERPMPEKLFISAEIVVERDNQKGIIIGKGGEALRKLGSYARVQIEEFLEQPVFLELFVKVRPDWRQSESRLRSFGY